MRTSLIATALVALIITASTSVPGISALSCGVDQVHVKSKHSNSSRVVKEHKSSRKGHRHPLTASNSTVAGINSKNRTVSSNSTSNTGLIIVVDKQCGPNGATLKSSKSSGPNGAIQWLNCGISKSDPSSGWTPPTILMTDLKYKTLDAFVTTTFKACKTYLAIFNQVATSTGIPAIFIASFAMQESSCNSNSSGDNGDAYGLMQITSDKCGGAPNGNCADPLFNVKTGAEYFASQLKAFKGDVMLAIGQYNGWEKGMSYASATAAANGGCCDCQNNLDYIHSFFNGWIQGIDGDSITYYNNLAVCGN